MNEYIEYYYGFSKIDLTRLKDCYYFIYNNDSYYFCKLTRTEDELKEILLLTKENNLIYKIVSNINREYVTHIYDSNYILLKCNNSTRINGYQYILSQKNKLFEKYAIDRSDWVNLWSKKIDNVEHTVNFIGRKYPIIRKSVWYYIGLSEIAIIYMRRVLDKNKNRYKVISHIRMSDIDIFNPQNLIIDFEGRDIAEYLKYTYFHNYDKRLKIVDNFFNNRKFDKFLLQTIYGRLFFPTFYFDMLDDVVNGNVVESKLNYLIKSADDYEQYINYIYNVISTQKKIPKVMWF